MAPKDFDHPIVFLFVIAVGVAAVWSIISWGLVKAGWTGPLGLFKGGIVSNQPSQGM